MSVADCELTAEIIKIEEKRNKIFLYIFFYLDRTSLNATQKANNLETYYAGHLNTFSFSSSPSPTYHFKIA